MPIDYSFSSQMSASFNLPAGYELFLVSKKSFITSNIKINVDASMTKDNIPIDLILKKIQNISADKITEKLETSKNRVIAIHSETKEVIVGGKGMKDALKGADRMVVQSKDKTAPPQQEMDIKEYKVSKDKKLLKRIVRAFCEALDVTPESKMTPPVTGPLAPTSAEGHQRAIHSKGRTEKKHKRTQTTEMRTEKKEKPTTGSLAATAAREDKEIKQAEIAKKKQQRLEDTEETRRKTHEEQGR